MFKNGLSILSMIVLSLSCQTEDNIQKLPLDALIRDHQALILAVYEDSLSKVRNLDLRINAMIDQPSQSNLDQAREAWLEARLFYLQSEVFRFYDGPIDQIEGLINAWPLDEMQIDYVQGDVTTGLINDMSIIISEQSILDLNELQGEKDIKTGFHAIEFLLWGQDLDRFGPGNRSVVDFQIGIGQNADRRVTYLRIISSLLVKHLEQLVQAWLPLDGVKTRFDIQDVNDSFRDILTGMIVLSGFETGGERLQAALDSKEQEDEHSCFSDNTHIDMIQNIQGIKNVFLGIYQRADGRKITGTGIQTILDIVNPKASQSINQLIEESLAYAQSLEIPFDQEIALDNPNGNRRVSTLIVSLRNLENQLQSVFQSLQFTLPIETE
jgi:putative iron-regulated protein